jgi:hypothetical protein
MFHIYLTCPFSCGNPPNDCEPQWVFWTTSENFNFDKRLWNVPK